MVCSTCRAALAKVAFLDAMRLPLFALMVFVALATASPSVARAEDDTASAKDHYQRGTKLYDILKYREAAREFELAYQAKADPAFLYNMGQAYRLAGDNEKAMGAYRSYLRRVPEARNRREVEEHIGALQRALEQEKQARERSPADTQSPAPLPDGPPSKPAEGSPEAPPPSSASTTPATRATDAPAGSGFTKKVAGGVVAGVGLVAVGVGAAFAALAQSASNQITNPAPGSTFDPSLEETFKTDRTIAIAMIAGGGVALAGGAALLLLGVREGHKAPVVSLLPVVGAGRVGASFLLRF